MPVSRLEKEIGMPEFIRWLAFWEVRAMRRKQQQNQQKAAQQVAPARARRPRRGHK